MSNFLRITVSLLLTVLLQSTHALAGCTSELNPRKDVYVFSYNYSADAGGQHKLSIFLVKILKDRMEQLMFETSQTSDTLSYLIGVALDPSDPTALKPFAFSSLEEALIYWDTANALALMYGTLTDTPKTTIDVESTIVSGAFGKELNSARVKAKLTGDTGSVEAANDTHLLVLMYLLASDAEERQCDNPTVIKLYSQARRLAINLQRIEFVQPTIEKMRIAIDSKLQALAKQ